MKRCAAWHTRDMTGKCLASSMLTTLGGEGAVVPAIFTFEIENILIVAARRRRIDAEVEEAIGLLRTLDLQIESYGPLALGRHIDFARRYALTTYDAAYVVLAAQLRIPLYTADGRFAAAARKRKIASALVA